MEVTIFPPAGLMTGLFGTRIYRVNIEKLTSSQFLFYHIALTAVILNNEVSMDHFLHDIKDFSASQSSANQNTKVANIVLNRKNQSPKQRLKDLHLCSQHFTPEDFESFVRAKLTKSLTPKLLLAQKMLEETSETGSNMSYNL